jgi:hypothetical protein
MIQMAVIVETVARKTAFFKTLDDADEVPVYLEKGVKLKELSNGEFFCQYCLQVFTVLLMRFTRVLRREEAALSGTGARTLLVPYLEA